MSFNALTDDPGFKALAEIAHTASPKLSDNDRSIARNHLKIAVHSGLMALNIGVGYAIVNSSQVAENLTEETRSYLALPNSIGVTVSILTIGYLTIENGLRRRGNPTTLPIYPLFPQIQHGTTSLAA